MSENENQEKAKWLKKSIESWPYAEDLLLETLESDLIEGHGIAQLSRALNLGRVIAVVGSGITNAYGRPSWSELMRDLVQHVGGLVDAYSEVVESSQSANTKFPRDLQIDALNNARKNLGLTDHRIGVPGKMYPVAFQLCDTLEHKVIDFFQRHPLAQKAVKNEAKLEKLLQKKDFRKRLKRDLFDETGRARILIESLTRNIEMSKNFWQKCGTQTSKIKAHKALEKALERIRIKVQPFEKPLQRDGIQLTSDEDLPDDRKIALAIYSPKSIKYLLEILSGFSKGPTNSKGPTGKSEPSKFLENFSEKLNQDTELLHQPNLHFIVQMICTVAIWHYPEGLTQWLISIENIDGDKSPDLNWDAGTPSRHTISPPHRDPLAVIFDDLGIDRFLTTNYDNDIEQIMLDRGYRLVEGDSPDRNSPNLNRVDDVRADVVNMLGQRGEDFVFRQDQVSNLVDFGTHGWRDHKRILHLHGRALDPSPIVITEKDYQDLYLRTDGDRELTDDAMSLVFGSNPLLFVGLGMTEPDILRPLRIFSSNRSALTDRVGVALLPRPSTPQDAAMKQVELLSRYGVYSVFYGSATYGPKNSPCRDDDALSKIGSDIDHLVEHSSRLLYALFRWADPENDRYAKGMPNEFPGAPDDDQANRAAWAWERLYMYCTPIVDEDTRLRRTNLGGSWHEQEKWTIDSLNTHGNASYPGVIPDILKIESSSVADLPVKFEIDTFNLSVKNLFVCTERALEFLQTLDWSTAAEPGKISKVEVQKRQAYANLVADVTALWIAFRHLKNAFYTPFVVAGLRGFEQNWRNWRSEWLRKPQPREVLLNSDIGPNANGPECLNRHRTVLRDLVDEHFHSDGDYSPKGFQLADGNFITSAPSTDRFIEGAAPPALQAFFCALRENKLNEAFPKNRRIFLTIAKRGVGKGHIISSLRSNTRFYELAQNLGLVSDYAWPDEEQGKKFWDNLDKIARENTATIHRGFFHLGLSHEVLSVFDQLATFLYRSLCRIYATDNIGGAEKIRKAQKDWEDIGCDRKKRMTFVMSELDQAGKQIRSQQMKAEARPPRIVVGFSHLHLLFDSDGNAKNAMTLTMFEELIGYDYENAPIDFLFTMNEGVAPVHFQSTSTSEGSFAPGPPAIGTCVYFDLLAQPGATRQATLKAKERLKRSGLNVAPTPKEGADIVKGFVHLLQEVRPSILALRYFPLASFIIAWTAIDEHNKGTMKRTENLKGFPSSNGPSSYFEHRYTLSRVHNLQYFLQSEFARKLSDGDQLMFNEGRLDRLVSEFIAFNIIQDQNFSFNGLTDDQLTACENDLDTTAQQFFNHRWLQFSRMSDDLSSLDGDPATWEYAANLLSTKELKPRLGQATPVEIGKLIGGYSEAILKAFNSIGQDTGKHRFALTALLACIDDMLEVELRAESNQTKISDNVGESISWAKSIKRAKKFTESLSLKTRQHHDDIREDMSIDTILGYYKRQHDTIKNWPFEPSPLTQSETLSLSQNLAVKTEEVKQYSDAFRNALECTAGPDVHLIQEAILVDLALIGQPTDACVLLSSPDISNSLERLQEAVLKNIKLPPKGNPSISRLREGVLKDPKPFQMLILRRILDLLVHRCLVMRMGAKPKPASKHEELPDEYRYAVHKAIRRIVYRRIGTPVIDYSEVDQLTVSQYATQPNELPRPNANSHDRLRKLMSALAGQDYQIQPGRIKDGRELRAAYGILRSVYSAGVVTSFDSYSEQIGHLPPKEGYIEEHRQLVRWMIKRTVDLQNITNEDTVREIDQKPFYAEEIAWLYNECGVLSLIQGKLGDAAALFNMAIGSSREGVETLKYGPLHTRIGMNRAICAIERGQPRRAWAFLQRVSEDPKEHEAIRWIAHGYIGLLKHLQGDVVGATGHYVKAEERLTSMERYRAASIFARHHGDLLRMKLPSGDDRDNPLAIANRAERLAANGNHEDVRQLAVVSKLKIQMRLGDISFSQVMATLDQVEKYARKVGMPRLLVETTSLRSLVMLAQGESQLSSKFAMEALKISTRHGMQLRKITGLIILARSLHSEHRQMDSLPILRRASELATRAEFHSAKEGVETLIAAVSSGISTKL